MARDDEGGAVLDEALADGTSAGVGPDSSSIVGPTAIDGGTMISVEGEEGSGLRELLSLISKPYWRDCRHRHSTQIEAR